MYGEISEDITIPVGETLKIYDENTGRARELKIEGIDNGSNEVHAKYLDTGEEVDLNLGTPDEVNIDDYKITKEPYYLPVNAYHKVVDGNQVDVNELDVLMDAYASKKPMMLKGPTGCGKTRLIEHFCYKTGQPMFYAIGNEDLSSNDLIGRYIVKGDEIKWQDGPLTLAARHGGVFYLDEIAEARKDVLSKVNEATDHQRKITLEKKGGEIVHAADDFYFVSAYNPGYQRTQLKPSLQQRFMAVDIDYARDMKSPQAELETQIVAHEGNVDMKESQMLVEIGVFTRKMKELKEGAGTRTLIATAELMDQGYTFHDACQMGIVSVITEPLPDYTDVREAIMRQVDVIEGQYNRGEVAQEELAEEMVAQTQ